MLTDHQIADVRMFWAIAGSVPAVIEDLWRRRISNAVCAMLLAGGLLLGSMETGMRGLGHSILGAAAGFSVFLIFYLMRAMGGGDVKLMAGYGALLGVRDILLAAVIAALAGALIALASVAFARLRGTSAEFIPYAPAIAFGSLVILLSRAAEG
jgi:prepilin peptidase CpaA